MAGSAAVSKELRGGFSLLELLIVLAIVVAVSGLMLPHMMGADGRIDLDAESHRLGRLVRLAQARALATRSDVTVRTDTAAGQVFIDGEDLAEKLRVDVQTVVPPGDLVFSPDGGPSSEKTYTLVGSGGESRTVTVKAGTGHVAYGP